MKNVYKTVFAALLLGASALAFSASASSTLVDLNQLPAEVKAQVLEAQKQQKLEKDNPLLAVTKEWSQLGQAMGIGLVSAAKELGVAANEFAKSDLGKIVVFVMVWKFLGASLLSVIFGTLIMVAGAIIGLAMVRDAKKGNYQVEYAAFPMLFGLFTIRRVVKCEVTPKQHLSDYQCWQQGMGYLVLICSAIIGVCKIS